MRVPGCDIALLRRHLCADRGCRHRRHRRCGCIRRCAARSRGRKCAIRPWIGHAAASPSAQMVWPSTCLVTSKQHVDLALVGAAVRHPGQHPPHPADALAARRALAAALVLVEIGDARDRPDDVGRLVHHDDRGGAETANAACRGCRNPSAVSMICSAGTMRHRRAAGDDRLEIVPAAAHAAAMALDQFAERNAHRLFDLAGPLDVAGDAEQLGAGIVGPADAGEPGGAAAQDVGRHRDRLRRC